MTGWGQRPAAIAAVQRARASDAMLTLRHSEMNCPTAANPPGMSGWQWSFQIRSADGASGSSSTDAKAEHPTRRSRKLARLEAVLLVADGALSFRKISQFATLADAAEARELVQELNDKLDRGGAAFRIEKVATGVRMMTRPQFSMWLDRLQSLRPGTRRRTRRPILRPRHLQQRAEEHLLHPPRATHLPTHRLPQVRRDDAECQPSAGRRGRRTRTLPETVSSSRRGTVDRASRLRR